MKTLEIIDAFMKGHTVTNISEKQKNWLISQAKSEGFKVDDIRSQSEKTVYTDDCLYRISPCQKLVSSGSYVGRTAINGLYKMERYFSLLFPHNGFTCTANEVDMADYISKGYEVKVLNPNL